MYFFGLYINNINLVIKCATGIRYKIQLYILFSLYHGTSTIVQ
jgi:hypothetical protein